jgi:hypothetical protein
MRLMVHSRKVCANALGSDQPNRLQIQSYASKYCPFRADRRTAFLPMFAAQAIALLELPPSGFAGRLPHYLAA